MPVKALLALMIVAHHISYYSGSSVIHLFYHLGPPIVSIFLFISGYGLVTSYRNDGRRYLDTFFRRRILAIFVPFAVTVFVHMLFNYDAYSDVAGLLANMSHGVLPLSNTWYVFAILYFYLVFWLSYRYLPPRARLFSIVAGSILYVVTLRLMNFAQCWYISAMGFVAGTAMAESGFKFERLKSDIALLAVSVIAGGTFFFLGSSWCYQLCYIFIPIAFAVVVAMLPLEKLNVRPVRFLGRISYSVYLCQMIVIQPFWENGFGIESQVLKILLSYATIIVLAYLITMAAKLLNFQKY